MHPRTIATLRQLQEADWLAHTGKQDSDLSLALVLSSWDEAIESIRFSGWEQLCLEASNQYRERLLERSVERFRKWNEIVEMLKPTTIPFVKRKISPFVEAFNLPKVFEDQVQWDILGVCLEAEYADVFPPSFYTAVAFYYTKGHFPCGWEGEFPKGRPIIF